MSDLEVTMWILQLSVFLLNVIVQGYSAQLFPYGSTEGDTLLPKGDDGNSGEISISNIFTFFGVPYESLFVNINGAVSFSNGIQTYTPKRFPLGDDYVIIAPFWTDIDTSHGMGHGDVMYRQLLSTNQTLSLFTRANEIVRHAYGDQNTFSATWMLIATWSRVAYYNAMNPSSLVNTFQCILVTDGDFCGVIMIYGDISWAGDEDSIISSISDTEENTTAQAGFNAGDKVHYYEVESSGTSDIIDIEMKSNIGQPGTWVFRVDGVDIIDALDNAATTQEEPGMTTVSTVDITDALDNAATTREEPGITTVSTVDITDAWDTAAATCEESAEALTIYPKIVPMLGGTMVSLSGPCFNSSNHAIQCDFGGVIANGNVTSTSNATCVTPALFVSGVIDVRLSLDGGSTYPHVGILYVAGDEPPPVNFTDTPNGNLAVTWNPTALTGIDAVEVVVYEFSSDSNHFISWEPVYTISRRISSQTGRLEFTVRPGHNVNDASPKVGAIGILELDKGNHSLVRRAIWSEIHPLNWLYPINTTSWCQSWVTQELSELDEWLPHRSICPCTERQARRDIGSFTAFLDCRGTGREEECSSHRTGAMFCVYSNTPSVLGAGQECCYNNDGHLIELGSPGAGFSQRQHNRVSSPFLFAGLGPVPVLSHYLVDTMPYLQCCVADRSESEGLCDLYRSVRPPNNCYGYRPPHPATAFGDPHFITFDGLNYTFNGYGEFTLANFNEDEFILQARSLPMTETPNATIFTAVATKTTTSDVIHVESNQRRGVSVFFRREGRNFEEVNFALKKTWYLRAVTLKAGDNLTAEGLSIVFDNGIALKMTTHDDALDILVIAPYKFKDKTQGMVGTWNDDLSDDLQTPDDVIIPPTSSMETIFHEFGNRWRVKENESLFYYRTGFNQSSYTNYTYKPLLIEPAFLLDDRYNHVCGNDQSCAFDLFVTGRERFATQTLNAINLHRSTSMDLVPVTCQSVSVTNGCITSSDASPGSLARFSCDPCYELHESINTTCGSNGMWLHPLPSCTRKKLLCDKPLAPPNGHVMIGGCPIIYATFTCKGGYDLSGRSMMECKPDGQWSHPFPACEKMSKGLNMSLSSVHAAAIGGGTAVFILILCLILACLVTRHRHLKRKQELRKRASNMWSTTRNPLYDPKSCTP